ncbi:MAG: dihydrodipicolinate synthase family protein, partial [Anaerolineae bacterium]|nr:dihydrodipicolinate synthase family protein [Anaerolineae bacterium]
LKDLLQFLLQTGVQGFYTTGGTGESMLLDPDERRQVLETTLEVVNGRVPVIAHVGDIATHVAVDLAKHAASVGADGIAAVPPPYFPVDQAALHAHYQAIAEAAGDVPVWIYYIPGATGSTISTESFKSLLTIEQIVGVKYTAINFFEMRNLIEAMAGRDFTIMSGADDSCLPALTMGAAGAIGTTYNIMAGHFVQLYAAYERGDIQTAQDLQYAANRVIKALLTAPVIAGVKLILKRMGFDCGTPRRPLRPLTREEEIRLWAALDATEFTQIAGIPLQAE